MDFTIYTFGDVEIFRSALTGVAMIFSGSAGFLTSDSSALGLGAMAGLGLLIGLALMLVAAIQKQQVDAGGFVLMLLVFVMLFVPKFRVQVEDYNGEGIAAVDDVPMGLVLPAAFVSGLARELNITMGTAFSTISGTPSGLMTPGAITSPLKLLYSLRNVSTMTPSKGSTMTGNVANVMAYCVAGRPGAAKVWNETSLAADPVAAMLDFAVGQVGLVMVTDEATQVQGLDTCTNAAAVLKASLGDFAADDKDAPFSKLAGAAATASNAAQVTYDGTSGRYTVQPVTLSTLQDALTTIDTLRAGATASADLARRYATFQAFAGHMANALYCAEKSASPEAWAQCLPLTQAVGQQQEDSAAQGSMFQRLMFHGMNALFFIWICLAPVVATLMLVMGPRGLKVMASYLLFGAWSVSWYVGATVVNFYMLKQVQYSVAMLGGLEAFTIESWPLFYDTLGSKLGLAGTMLASVPLLMMALLSGSMYGMTALAQTFGGKDHFNEKANSPDMVDGSPMFQRQAINSQVSYDPRVGTGMDNGGVGAPTINTSAVTSSALANSRQSTEDWAKRATGSLRTAVQNTWTAGTSAEASKAMSDNFSAGGQSALAAVTNLSRALSHGTRAGNSTQLTFSDGVHGEIGGGVILSGGAKMSMDQARALGLSKEDMDTFQKVQSGDASFRSQLNSELSSLKSDRVAELGSIMHSKTGTSDWASVEEHGARWQSSETETDTLSRANGVNADLNFGQLARRMDGFSDTATSSIRGAIATHFHDPKARENFERLVDVQLGGAAYGPNSELRTLHKANPEALRALAGLDVLSRHHQVAFAQAVNGITGASAPVVSTPLRGLSDRPDTPLATQARERAQGALPGTETKAQGGAERRIAQEAHRVAGAPAAVTRHAQAQDAEAKARSGGLKDPEKKVQAGIQNAKDAEKTFENGVAVTGLVAADNYLRDKAGIPRRN